MTKATPKPKTTVTKPKREKPAPLAVPVDLVDVAPVDKPVNQKAKLEAMLHELKLNDAQARLERATAAQNPDAMLAAMDEIVKLKDEGK